MGYHLVPEQSGESFQLTELGADAATPAATGKWKVYLKAGGLFLVEDDATVHQMWSDDNDGSGSGLDADTTDGVHINTIVQDRLLTVDASGDIEDAGVTNLMAFIGATEVFRATTTGLRIEPDGIAGNPVSTHEISGSTGYEITATAIALTLTSAHRSVIADAVGGAFDVTLPTAASAFTNGVGREYKIKRINAGGNKVTVAANGAETIDGVATFKLNQQFDHVTVQSDGTEWHVL